MYTLSAKTTNPNSDSDPEYVMHTVTVQLQGSNRGETEEIHIMAKDPHFAIQKVDLMLKRRKHVKSHKPNY